jgi:hypothetical protein
VSPFSFFCYLFASGSRDKELLHLIAAQAIRALEAHLAKSVDKRILCPASELVSVAERLLEFLEPDSLTEACYHLQIDLLTKFPGGTAALFASSLPRKLLQVLGAGDDRQITSTHVTLLSRLVERAPTTAELQQLVSAGLCPALARLLDPVHQEHVVPVVVLLSTLQRRLKDVMLVRQHTAERPETTPARWTIEDEFVAAGVRAALLQVVQRRETNAVQRSMATEALMQLPTGDMTIVDG